MPRKSAKQKVFRYSMGLHFGLCHGPVDRFLRFLAGEREAWAGSVDANATVAVDAPDLFGGDKSEGGIVGNLTVMMGAADQTLPAVVSAALPEMAPAFRGVLSLFYDGRVSTNNPYVKPMAFQVERIIEGWAGAGCWYPGKAPVPLTDPVTGFSESPFFAVACGTGQNTDTPVLYHVPGWNAVSATVGDDELYFAGYASNGSFSNRIATVASSAGVDIAYGQDFAIEFEYWVDGTSGIGSQPANYAFCRAQVDATDYTAGHTFNEVWAFANNNSLLRFRCNAIDVDVTCALTTGAWAKYRVERVGTTLSLYKDDVLVDAVECTQDAIEGPCPIGINGPYQTYSPLPNCWSQGAENRYRNLRMFAGSTAPGLMAMNPAHIIYQCLTDPQWGMGYPTAAIDDASFTAAADTLYAEGLGLCLLWNKADEIGSFVRQVLDHAGAVLYTDPQTGKFKLKLLRADYDAGTLPVFDESNIVALDSFQRVGYGDTVNEIVVVYRDVATNKNAPVTVQNLANIQAQGGVVSQTRQYPGLPTEGLALRIAQRDLDASSIPLAKARIKVNRKGWALTPGAVFKLSWPKLGLSSIVMRVLGIDSGTLEDGTITVDCAEDVFGLPASTYAEQEPAGWVAPSTDPEPITRQAMVETPYYLLAHALSASDLAALDADAAYFAATASRPTSLSVGFQIQSRVGAAAYAATGDGLFVPGADLSAALDQQAGSLVLAAPTDLADVSAGMLAIVGTGRAAEIMRVTAVDTGTSSVSVDRAVLDTTPQPHAAGAPVFFIAGDGDEARDITERATAETIDYKLLPQTTGAQLAEALATPMTVTADQRQARPLAPGNTRINDVMFPASVLGTITVSWAHRNRLQQTEGIVLQTDGSVTPEAGTSYTVWVFDDETGAQMLQVAGIAETSRALVVPTGSLLRVEVAAVRAGLESWQRQVRRFAHTDGLLLLENGDVLTMEPGQLASQESAPPDTSGFAHRATFALTGTHSADDRLQFSLQFNGSSQYVSASAAGTSTLAEFASVIAQQFIAQGRYATVEGDSVHVHSAATFLGASVVSSWARYPVAYTAQAAAAPAAGGNQWTFVDLYASIALVATCPSPAPALANSGLAQTSIDVYKRLRSAAPITGGHEFPGGGAARRFYFSWSTNSIFSDYLHQIEGLVDAINGDADLAANGITASLGSLSPPPTPDTPITRTAVVITATDNYGVDVNGQFAGGANGTPINPWPMSGSSHPSGYPLGIAQWADMGPAIPSGLPQISAFDPRPGAGYGFAAGQQWWLDIDGTEYHYTLSGTETSGADVAAGLAALVDPGGDWAVTWDDPEALVTATAVDTPFTCSVWASYGVRVAASIDF